MFEKISEVPPENNLDETHQVSDKRIRDWLISFD